MKRTLLSLTFCLCLPFTAQASTTVSEPVCVVKGNVSLRKGPGRDFPVSWAVPKYMPLQVVDQKGSWLRVRDLDGEHHWVEVANVSKKVSCAVVKSKTAKLRRGPGSEEPLADLSSVDKYTPFQKVDRDGEWVQVKDIYQGTYWVHETQIWIPMARTKISF